MAQYRVDQSKFLGDSKTLYEVVMLGNRFSASGTATDAFGRLRVSEPLTLFDSYHRYKENNKFVTSTSGTANTVYQINESVVDMNVGTASGDKCYRESKRVFAYQPGKSLLIKSTFVMNAQKTNLRQRVGYFGTNNGVFFENDGTGNYFVLRSYTAGYVQETRVAQANWNVDKFDGTGVSSQMQHANRGALDITKSNIFWIDIEWLGVGDVRCGFVVDGLMMPAHIFHNDNINTTTYMTTSILPVRYEIENTGITASVSTMKQICSTVISEGGYALTGKSITIGQDPLAANQFQLSVAGTYYPVVAIKLHSNTPDSIVIPVDVAVMPINSAFYRYKIINAATITGAVWANAAANSVVQYNTNTTATVSGGTEMYSGYVTSTVQGGGSITLSGADLFKYQLERDTFAGTQSTFVLAVASSAATSNVCGSISWEEVT